MKNLYTIGFTGGGILGMAVMSESPSIPAAIFTGLMFTCLGLIQKQRLA